MPISRRVDTKLGIPQKKYYKALKINKLQKHTTIWINLSNIMLNEQC